MKQRSMFPQIARAARILALLALVATLFGNPAPTRAAAHIWVTTNADGAPADDGVCTLREAIIAANTNTASGASGGECVAGGSGTDEIDFFDFYTITLNASQGSLTPSSNMVIYGRGRNQTIIQASTCNPTPDTPGCTTATYPVFQATGSYLRLEDMTVRHGVNAAHGGGIFVNGPLLETYNVSFFRNLGGDGGGVYIEAGELSLFQSTVDQNRATDDAGGVYNKGVLDMDRSTVSNNRAADFAGGIWHNTTGTGTISNSTIMGNTADSAGGLYNLGTVSLYNTTVAFNSDNLSVGGVYSDGFTSLGLSNALLADNDGYDCYNSSFGFITADVGNLIESNHNCGTPAVTSDPGPMFGGSHGGFTDTVSIEGDSSAYGAGDVTVCNGPHVGGLDQRERYRKLGRCDIGAYELPQTPTDFEPDGISEAAKYVPSAGAVYYYRWSSDTWDSSYVGTDGDYILNSDFDGDGRTDPAKYVAAAGAVWYLGSSDSAWHGVYIGSDGEYIPASDFDGDGKTDPAKYVTSAGAVWYRRSSDSTWVGVYIGSLGGGEYVAGSDFDGDRKSDPAHTDSAGNVWYLGSVDATLHGHFIGNDGPYVPRSDYDGDGQTDPAKFVSPNIWYISSSNFDAVASIPLGADTSFVVPGSDFDGDGITDAAKYVSSAGSIWFTSSRSTIAYGAYMGGEAYDIVN